VARALLIGLTAIAVLLGTSVAAAAEDSVAITLPAPGAVVGGVVPVVAVAPADTTSMVFEWSDDGATWNAIATDEDGSDGWTAAWDTGARDGTVWLRATAARPGGAESTVIDVVLRNAPTVKTWVRRAHFSPNRDGRRDTAYLGASLNEAGRVRIRVVDADGRVRRTWEKSLSTLGSVGVRWGGRSARGRLLRDGSYRVLTVGWDLAQNKTKGKARRVVIDTVAPRIAWDGVSPEPSSGRVRQYFSFKARDADRFFAGRLAVRSTVRRVGLSRFSLDLRDATVSWKPRRALYPGTYRTRVRLVDQAANVGWSRAKPWRVHRSMTGKIVQRLEDTGRVVALTFDDCGDADAWRTILDVLRARGLKASFFCPGSLLSSRARLARRTVDDGHSVGAHGWDHANLAGQSDSFVRSRMLKDRAAWWKYGRATSAPYFRPPYMAYDDRVVRTAGETSMPRVMLWDVDPRDWERPGTSALVQRVAGGARPGSIVVLHTIAETARALPAMLDALAAKNLRPVNLDRLFYRAR